MKEFQDVALWIGSFGRSEAPFPALSEWLDFETRRARRREWAATGTVCAWILGLIVLYGGILILTEALYRWETGNAYFLIFMLGSTIAATPLALGCSMVRRWREHRDAQSIDPEVARAVTKLRTMHTPRRLARRLGKNGAIEMNEGAELYFRCRMALMSDAWNSQSPNEPWGEARSAMLSAMEAAMGRLALCVVKRRSFTEIGPILEEMRAATNEAVRVTELRSLTAGSAGQGLRASTHRMRELAKTEEEALAELRVTL